jgi:hypothetical protein
VLVPREFLQTQRLVLVTPTVEMWWAASAPADLVQLATLPSTAVPPRDQRITPLGFPRVCWVGAGDPGFGRVSLDSQLFQGQSDGCKTYLAPRQTLLTADLCGHCQRPTTRRLAQRSWTLGQQGLQCFTPGLVTLRWYRFGAGRGWFETRQALVLKSRDRIVYGLRGAAQMVGDCFGTVFATAGQQTLTSAQRQGIR